MPVTNIVMIVTDDQRYNTIHGLGNPDIHTPAMDMLVREGTVFTHAHIPGGSCAAVCMPSRAMLFSGKTLFHLQSNGADIPPQDILLPELLQQQGYECFATGKWHNGTQAFARGFTAGSNIFFGGMWDHWNVPVCRFDPTGEYDNKVNFTVDFWNSNTPTQMNCDYIQPGRHSSEIVTDAAIGFLEGRGSAKPFFMSVNYLAPHDPRTMPEEFQKMYRPEDIPLPENFMEQHPFELGVADIRDETLAAYPRKEQEIRQHLAEYYGMISHLDAQLGRLADALRQKGVRENTLVILTGDNGLALGSHGLMGKQNCYEHSVRVPLVLCGPGVPKGKQSSALVYLLDIYPTICEYLGLAAPASVEGKSFFPVVQDAARPHRADLYLAYGDLIRGVKDSRFKLLQYSKTPNCSQLFDLHTDPWELHNIMHKPEFAPEVQRLRQRLDEYRAEWEDDAR